MQSPGANGRHKARIVLTTLGSLGDLHPYIAVALSFFSVHDPPVLPPARFLARLRFCGPVLFWPLFWLIRRKIRSWSEAVRQLRVEVGLPPNGEDVLLEGQHAPSLVLALFSRAL